MHTIYAGAAPEYGKETFHGRFDRELERVKKAFPEATYIGLADGAPDNWSWLEPRTQRHLIDFCKCPANSSPPFWDGGRAGCVQ